MAQYSGLNTQWLTNVYLLETTDRVVGGADGVANRAARDLADRTAFLKAKVDTLDLVKAPLASPAFTGTPTVPTPAVGDNSGKVASTGFVHLVLASERPFEDTPGNIRMNGVQNVGQLASAARGDHVHPSDTTRAPLASPAFSGTPTVPTPAQGSNNLQIANTAFVQTALSGVAIPLESSSNNIKPLGVSASAGSSSKAARADHVHMADVPPGAILYTARTSAPGGWLVCNGAAVSRTAYASLFAAIGTTYGSGDGSNTFNLPDLRGLFIRSQDNGRGLDSEGSRPVGHVQGDAMRNATGKVSAFRSWGGDAAPFTYADGVFDRTRQTGRPFSSASGWTDTLGYSGEFNIDLSRQVPVASEVRVKNMALLPIIKY